MYTEKKDKNLPTLSKPQLHSDLQQEILTSTASPLMRSGKGRILVPPLSVRAPLGWLCIPTMCSIIASGHYSISTTATSIIEVIQLVYEIMLFVCCSLMVPSNVFAHVAAVGILPFPMSSGNEQVSACCSHEIWIIMNLIPKISIMLGNAMVLVIYEVCPCKYSAQLGSSNLCDPKSPGKSSLAPGMAQATYTYCT